MSKDEQKQYLEDLKPWVKDKAGRKALLSHRKAFLNFCFINEEGLEAFKKSVVSDIKESEIFKDHPVFNDFNKNDVKLLITSW